MQQDLFNNSFERTILNSIIFAPEIIEICYKAGLHENDFFSAFHQKLYKTIKYLSSKSVVDEDFIKKEMDQEFNEIMMLDVLESNAITNLHPYIKEVKELSQLRKANKVGYRILEGVQEKQSFSNLLTNIHLEIDNLENANSNLIDIRTFDSIVAKEAEFVCKNWLPFPKRAVSLVTAGGGVGKSFLLLQAAMKMIEDDKLKVFMWLSEDPIELSKFRFEMIANKVLHKPLDLYNDSLHIAGSDSETLLFLQEDRNKVSVNGVFYQFKNMLSEYDVIILDPLIAFFGGDENNNTHARQFINLFTRWATVEGKTIIFIHHGSKNTSQSRGASAFVDAVRLVYQLEVIKNSEGNQVEDHMRSVILAKDNNGAKKYLGGYQVKRKVFPEVMKQKLEIEFNDPL